MNELHFAYKIKQYLNSGLPNVRPEIAGRLAVARAQALAHQKQVVAQTVLATVGYFVSEQFEHRWFQQTLAAFVLLVGITCSTFWYADLRVNEITAIDSALLADDLPLAAFTDKGFAAWLNRGD